jgi:hypothetical protein
MSRYTFYLPGCNQLTGISTEDWEFLSEIAAENNTPPATFAAQLLANELAQWRDELRYAKDVQQELDILAEHQEKQVEEALA